MTLKPSYPGPEDATADLTAHGFAQGEHFWTKPSTDGFGFPMTALATVKHQRVDPKWNEPDYYTIEFHNH